MFPSYFRQKKCQELDGLPEVDKWLAYQTRQNEVVTRTLWEFKGTSLADNV